MRTAYLSMPADTPEGIRNRLISHLCNERDISTVTYWKKGTEYRDANLLEADLVYSYIPEFAWHNDNDLYVFMGRGQFSEWEKRDDATFAIINDKFELFHPEHGLENDYNDWKRKYGKLWVSPMDETTQVVNNLLLLLID